jgi:hypothetical protein
MSDDYQTYLTNLGVISMITPVVYTSRQFDENLNSQKIMEEINSQNYLAMMERAKDFRFMAIDSAITIESLISSILIEFLGTESTKETLQKHLFSDVLTFEKKIVLFSSLNKKKLFEPTIENKNLNNDLAYIKLLRNLMAHSALHTDKDQINNFNQREMKFISFTEKNNKEIKVKFYEMTDEPEKLIFSHNVLAKKCNATFEALGLILKWVEDKKPNG